MTLLHWERGGFAIYYKRLEQGRFHPRIFIFLYLIEVALLLEGIKVEGLQDIVKRLLQRIRTNTEVGIVEFQSGGVYIELQSNVESLCHVIEHRHR